MNLWSQRNLFQAINMLKSRSICLINFDDCTILKINLTQNHLYTKMLVYLYSSLYWVCNTPCTSSKLTEFTNYQTITKSVNDFIFIEILSIIFNDNKT